VVPSAPQRLAPGAPPLTRAHPGVRTGEAQLLAWWAVTETSDAQLTRETFDRLSAELEDLTTRGRVEIAAAIESARALGDLSENGDYHAAKDAQGKMESRIRQLQRLLKTATVVDAGQGADGTVAPGTVVALRYDGDDEDDTTDFFVGSIEERPGDLTVVSPGSPLGQALLGHAAGDSVEYAAPGGTLKVEIVSVGV
jgi:transcription elongation factor GreA